MHILLFLFIFIIAYAFSPGVLMPIPRKYKLKHVAAVHAVIIALILVITMNAVMRHASRMR